MEKQHGGADSFSGEKRPQQPVISDDEKAAVDLFYEKMGKLNESSGLSLVFNFRNTMLDLHCFYKEVIKRGGFYKVTKMGKWDDVASASNSKSCVSMPAAQLQNVYKMLILQYELMYFCRMPVQGNIWPDKTSQVCFGSLVSPSCSKGKRKHCDTLYPFSTVHPGDQDGRTDKMDRDGTWQVAKGLETVNKNSTMIISPNSNVQELMVDKPKAPLKPRAAYHIFLRLESCRLKTILGESSSSQNLREMAAAAWRCLPEKDRLPYIEASKMDKERYCKEMAAYKQLSENQEGKSQAVLTSATPNVLNFSTSTEPADDVYRVSLQHDSGNLCSPDESMVALAAEVMKKAESHDSIFQID